MDKIGERKQIKRSIPPVVRMMQWPWPDSKTSLASDISALALLSLLLSARFVWVWCWKSIKFIGIVYFSWVTERHNQCSHWEF